MPNPSPGDSMSMFDKLASTRKAKQPEQQKAQPQPVPELEPEPEQKRKGRPKGKRSNPDYTQVGAYIPIALEKQVKKLLVDEEFDFSELVSQLLEDWVKQKSS